MTGFVGNSPVLGTQPMDDYFAPDTIQRQPLGFKVSATDPFWGGADLKYLQASVTIALGNLCIENNLSQALLYPNTANLGYNAMVALSDMAANTYGWFLTAGRYPVKSTATVAADAATGLTGAGVIGANSAGKQLLGAHVVAPATTTVVKTASGQSGTKLLTLNTPSDIRGWFVGLALSGTGVAASTKITAIDPTGRFVTINNNLTAGIVGGSITGTYNDATIFYNVLTFSNPNGQGAIT